MPQVFSDPKEMKHDFAFLANSERNRQLFHEIRACATPIRPEYIVIPTGCMLMREEVEGKGFNLALILESEKAVLYYCKVVYVKDDALELDGVTQALVWRNRMKPSYKQATHEFVSDIFSKYLIEKYNVIVSDVYHSYGGMFMWQEQLASAIERNDREVSIYNQIDATIEKIDKESFNVFLDSLWSDDESRLHIRAVIKMI
ncbi:hypothetical protein [Vibrio parahaemolyticus]|uniref:hypothetical protein n=1 Tax=Vibrio parahaemolyticus TaxID=670 RepID=UPI00226B31A8|nr:hypothetical protein [Vibrio parahaemolyticus]MCX8941247.1 hypothetical protein [Vibrio parahaemolyticus]